MLFFLFYSYFNKFFNFKNKNGENMKNIYFLTINENNPKKNGFKNKEFTNLSKLKKYVSENHFKDQAHITCNFSVSLRLYKYANDKQFYSVA